MYDGFSSHILGLRASDGSVLWSRELGDESISSPAVVGGRVYVGSGGDPGGMFVFALPPGTPSDPAGRPSPTATARAGPGTRRGPGAVSPATIPRGYAVVRQAHDAPPGVQTAGSALCPSGTVVYGGGVFTASGDLAANVSSSYPYEGGSRGWEGSVNNASGADMTFDVYAVCGRQPGHYEVVEGSAVDDPAGTQVASTADCGGRLYKVLGGVARLSSPDTAVNVNGSIPYQFGKNFLYSGWKVWANNAGSGDSAVDAWAICARGMKLWSIRSSFPYADDPPGTEAFAEEACPVGTLPTGGGVSSHNSSTLVDVNSTYPDPGTLGWGAWENNAGSSDATSSAYVVCVL